ncbi:MULTISPECIES: DNA polymerase III subunit alpha [Thermodesulfobacterium]|jgi:DNA polymerase-3 subunit alpha|uniref:DNA polymerase III subunit alpha n=1 Tax=Thermodesulfobacterium TaxID=1740 RepID=UPI00074A4C86|nr:DNA polymerase III subunit alpha [Thermodesulfobacterium sp.]KUJ97842.1 MAG: DNA polymerase III, alpha subunit [Thermodesulfobacterium sp. 37_54]KUK19841.1 MAG: DNA polymerase III, alpha subunit [Thermodesulfobacterium commune]MBZ4682314.1 dnaE [Thermodesulfobacterium sp.]MDN5380251.1 polymerase subunit alpha [Thermodesulfobacterium sp.]HBT04168.1 DNA polymerase III subunit alpha [Thermodesulfobacterium commune]
MGEFVHLHLHTEWSLLDGAIRIKDLVNRLLDYQLPGCAITDHGTLYGIIHFYKALKEAGLKPIIGCEFYVAENSRFDKKVAKRGEAGHHLVLLAKDEVGYKNLIKLASKAYLEGFYYRPRIDKELLVKHHEGLIALSACLEGEIPKLILFNQIDKAIEVAKWYKDLFKEDFYLEVQRNGLSEQEVCNQKILEIAEKLKIKCVATADCHYLDKEDALAHEVLLCIQTGHKLSDPDRFKFNTDMLYLASAEDMAKRFQDLPSEVLTNSLEVFEKVNLELKTGEVLFPKAKVPEGETAESYFSKKAREGLEKRLSELEETGQLAAEKEIYRQRLEEELEVIIEKGYASYFLIVCDFIEWARSKGIPVGPGRGSAAGALTSYALGITNLDPIRWGLLFERFLNKERPSLPDIDVDFCKERRDEVIEYVAQTYGREYIAKIATFGQLKARQVVRDVGRVLGFKPKEIDPIAKMISPGIDVSLEKELERPEFQELMQKNEEIKKLFTLAKKLEGLPRHASQHAAGVIISGKPIIETAPLMKVEENEIVVQFDMKACEAVGLIKFDFLGLKTLTIIDKTLKLIKKYEGIDLDLNRIPLDDPKTFELLRAGETDGVFQLESQGMKDLLRRLKPSDFNDLIAVLALYRPGPLEGGLVDQYIETKHGRRKPEYLHPLLEPILKETYGVIVYQEQVMQIAQVMAGYTLGEADLLRRAIGKKEKELMESLKEEFVKRSVDRGIPEDIAQKVFDLIEKFADYGFNKSHSAAYALVAYQTAYLKAHYPVYFMASILTYEVDKREEVSKYISVANEMGIPILPPDINLSDVGFTVEQGAIRVGLQAVKNVGEEAVNEIINKRPYSSFWDFCNKVDTKKVNRKTIEALIKAGAFDSLDQNRAKLMHNLPSILSVTTQTKFSSLFGQATLLNPSTSYTLEEVPEWDLETKLAFEKESLGFYLSDHPVKRLRRFIEVFTPYNLENLSQVEDGAQVVLLGLISEIKLKQTKNGDKMAILTIEDEFSSERALVFPNLYKQNFSVMSEGSILWFRVAVDRDEDSLTLLVEDLAPFNDFRFFKEGVVNVCVPHTLANRQFLEFLKTFVTKEETNTFPFRLQITYPDAIVNFEINGDKLLLSQENISLLFDNFPQIKLVFTES